MDGLLLLCRFDDNRDLPLRLFATEQEARDWLDAASDPALTRLLAAAVRFLGTEPKGEAPGAWLVPLDAGGLYRTRLDLSTVERLLALGDRLARLLARAWSAA